MPAEETNDGQDPRVGSASEVSSSHAASASDAEQSAMVGAEPVDELPELEELTPELVEEEAIRGDFMIRWAVILLALLLGFSRISETRTLVHIRSGDQMRATGFLPPRTDPFSFTLDADKPIANVSWLFDHIISLVWLAGGPVGLSIFKSLIAALTAWVLVRISVANMPTWWNSICAVFAVVSLSSMFLPLTELVTALGVVLTLKLLHDHREGLTAGLLWKLPLLMVVWCNLDSRAWLGAAIVVFYALGHQLALSLLHRSDEAPTQEQGAVPGLLPIAAACVAALLINPFPLDSLTAAVSMYSAEYPTIAEQKKLPDLQSRDGASVNLEQYADGRIGYFSPLNPDAIVMFDHTHIAAIALLLIVLFVVLLSRRAGDLGMLAVIGFLLILTLIACHEMPVLAVACAVTAGTTAQRWYRSHFSMKYTVDPGEVRFSRGGRAVTVFAMAALGFVIVTGRLPNRAPIGAGFTRDTQTTLETLQTQLQDTDPEARILHTRNDQGDILIWLGRKSFVDSRIVPFGRRSDDMSVNSRHDRLLTNLLRPGSLVKPEIDPTTQRPKPPTQEEAMRIIGQAQADAAEEIRRFAVTHVMPRLSPPGTPDYGSVELLLKLPDWTLTEIGPSTALFRYSPGLTFEQRRELVPDFSKLAFAGVEPATPIRDFAREADFYQKYLYRERPFSDADLRLARHLIYVATSVVPPEQPVARLPMLIRAIRSLNQSLSRDNNNSEAWQQLGAAYMGLSITEEALGAQNSGTAPQLLRYFQAVMAFRMSAVGQPDSLQTWAQLSQLYGSQNRRDLELECLNRLIPILDEMSNEQVADFTAFYERRDALQSELDPLLEQVNTSLAEATDIPEDDIERAQFYIARAQELVQMGLQKRALELLLEQERFVRKFPGGDVLIGQLQLESGDIENGFENLRLVPAAVRSQPDVFAPIQWHFVVAMANLSVCNYEGAIDAWTTQLVEMDRVMNQDVPTNEIRQNVQTTLLSAPLAAEVSFGPGLPAPVWPLTHLQNQVAVMQGFPRLTANNRFMIAMTRIEEGNITTAVSLLQSILREGGNSEFVPLSMIYLDLMGSDVQAFAEQNSLMDWEVLEFTPTTAAGPDGGAAPAAAAPAGGGAPAAADVVPATDGQDAGRTSDQPEPPTPGPGGQAG